jgi:hypothetical protein
MGIRIVGEIIYLPLRPRFGVQPCGRNFFAQFGWRNYPVCGERKPVSGVHAVASPLCAVSGREISRSVA